MDSCEGSDLSDEEFPGKCMHFIVTKTGNSRPHHTGYIVNLCFNPTDDFFVDNSNEEEASVTHCAEEVSTTEQLLPDKTPAVSQHLEELPTAEMLWGFKIVGDNVDKNVKASFQRHEIKSQSLHYFHCYAVRDRVPTDSFSDLTPVTCVPDPAQLLPSLEDLECVRQEMSVLLSR